MRNILAMFPGQGSQSIGMAKELLEQFPSTRTTFEEVEDATNLNIRRLCNEGPEDELKLTANQQPCILAVSIATWKVLKKESECVPVLFAGHSLGEYSALVAADKMDLSVAARLVRARGQAMQDAVPEGIGAMAAILRYEEEKLLKLCSEISAKGQGLVQIVNFNSPKQLIISGHKAAVEAVCSALSEEKVSCVLLPVSAPFHSALMTPAREKMAPLLKATTLKDSSHKIIANLTGKIADPYSIDLLIQQIDSPVLWTQSIQTAIANSANTFVEIGPGAVLFGLLRRWLAKEYDVKQSNDLRETIAFLTHSATARD